MFFVQETMPQEGSRISAFSQKKMTDDKTQFFNRPATVSCFPLVVCMHSGKHILIKSFLFYHVANKTELRNLNSYRDLVTFLKLTPKRQEEDLSSMHKFKNMGESSRGKKKTSSPPRQHTQTFWQESQRLSKPVTQVSWQRWQNSEPASLFNRTVILNWIFCFYFNLRSCSAGLCTARAGQCAHSTEQPLSSLLEIAICWPAEVKGGKSTYCSSDKKQGVLASCLFAH